MEARDRASAQRTAWDLPIERVTELDAIRRAVGAVEGLDVLDAGCGVGMMTRAVDRAARIAAVDFSWQGLLKFYFEGTARVTRLQADVCRLPLRTAAFDVAISSQVLEHIPSSEERSAFIHHLARVLKANGRLVLTAYNWDEGRRASGVAKEGFHPNGIFYHCFDRDEFRDALAEHFTVESVWSVHTVLPFTHRLVQALGHRAIYWDRLWRGRRVALPYGHLLLATCRRGRI
jgi:SAM-dependent methyltransferase